MTRKTKKCRSCAAIESNMKAQYCDSCGESFRSIQPVNPTPDQIRAGCLEARRMNPREPQGYGGEHEPYTIPQVRIGN